MKNVRCERQSGHSNCRHWPSCCSVVTLLFFTSFNSAVGKRDDEDEQEEEKERKRRRRRKKKKNNNKGACECNDVNLMEIGELKFDEIQLFAVLNDEKENG